MTARQAEAHAREAVRRIFATLPPVKFAEKVAERQVSRTSGNDSLSAENVEKRCESHTKYNVLTKKHLTLVVSR